jgi:2-polyprenyl-3-methyl-5-hydroxy-6-metoxy-1,4-benzoquinol methylase
MPSLRYRDRQPELMDDPAIDPATHRAALAGLARLNRVSGSAAAVWPAVRRLAAERSGSPVKLLDIATGSGDVLLGLARRAKRAGISLVAEGCDVSATAVATATDAARAAGLPARFFRADALADPLPTGYDAAVCSLFLHHLDEADAVTLLTRMRETGARLVVVNDLARSSFNYAIVWAASRLLTRSPVVHVDGPLSVRAAFTPAELRGLAAEAGLTGTTVTPRFPGRMVLEWRAP